MIKFIKSLFHKKTVIKFNTKCIKQHYGSYGEMARALGKLYSENLRLKVKEKKNDNKRTGIYFTA
jgi:hypothetical protein